MQDFNSVHCWMVIFRERSPALMVLTGSHNTTQTQNADNADTSEKVFLRIKGIEANTSKRSYYILPRIRKNKEVQTSPQTETRFLHYLSCIIIVHYGLEQPLQSFTTETALFFSKCGE